jgi:hypothetical protein
MARPKMTDPADLNTVVRRQGAWVIVWAIQNCISRLRAVWRRRIHAVISTYPAPAPPECEHASEPRAVMLTFLRAARGYFERLVQVIADGDHLCKACLIGVILEYTFEVNGMLALEEEEYGADEPAARPRPVLRLVKGTAAHASQPLGIGDVVRHQVSPPRHLVIIGTYSGSSPTSTAAKSRAWTSSTRR